MPRINNLHLSRIVVTTLQDQASYWKVYSVVKPDRGHSNIRIWLLKMRSLLSSALYHIETFSHFYHSLADNNSPLRMTFYPAHGMNLTPIQPTWSAYPYHLVFAKPFGLKVEAMTSAEIDIETVCPLKTPTFPPGTHEYDPKRHCLIEGVSKCMIKREEAQAKFREHHDAQRPHDEVYTDGSKIGERVGAAAVIIRQFQNGEMICPQLSKRLPNNSTIFAAEATAITLALSYYRHMDPVQHGVVIYSDTMSCLQAIEGEDTDNPLICQIMNLLWALSDEGTCVRFCWVASHCGIEGMR